jgi:hypothetical protein
VRSVEHLRDLADDCCSRRVRELGELLQMLAQLMPGARRFDRGANQDGALRRRMEID